MLERDADKMAGKPERNWKAGGGTADRPIFSDGEDIPKPVRNPR
jgi:hypothetical protein